MQKDRNLQPKKTLKTCENILSQALGFVLSIALAGLVRSTGRRCNMLNSTCIDQINNNDSNQHSTSSKKDVHLDSNEETKKNQSDAAGQTFAASAEDEVDKARLGGGSRFKRSDAQRSAAPIKNCEWYACDMLSNVVDENVRHDGELPNNAAAANVGSHSSSKLTTPTSNHCTSDCHSIGSSENSPNSTGNYRQIVLTNFSTWFNEISTGSLFQSLLSNPFRRRNSRQSATNSPSITRSNSNVLSSDPHHLDDRDQQPKRGLAQETARDPAKAKELEEEEEEEDSDAVRKFIGAIQPTLKGKELIELANFGVVEIDGQEPGLGHRFEVRKISFVPLCLLVSILTIFVQIFHLDAHTFCDNCSEFIWTPIIHHSNTISASIVSPYSKTVRCINCKYTCHYRCSKFVRINCQKTMEFINKNGSLPNSIAEQQSLFKQPSTSSEEANSEQIDQRPYSPLFFERGVLEEKIQKYNQRIAHRGSGLGIYLLDDGHTFRGFLRVHMNLTRPINVIAGTRPPSIYDIINDKEITSRRTLTTFYMPRDTVKNIHINSLNTSIDVIKAMLKKFKMVDNSQKYALYKKFTLDPKSTPVLSRIADQDHPLRIALEWLDSEDKSLVLQENDTADVSWDEFQLPELNNFLKVCKFGK